MPRSFLLPLALALPMMVPGCGENVPVILPDAGAPASRGDAAPAADSGAPPPVGEPPATVDPELCHLLCLATDVAECDVGVAHLDCLAWCEGVLEACPRQGDALLSCVAEAPELRRLRDAREQGVSLPRTGLEDPLAPGEAVQVRDPDVAFGNVGGQTQQMTELGVYRRGGLPDGRGRARVRSRGGVAAGRRSPRVGEDHGHVLPAARDHHRQGEREREQKRAGHGQRVAPRATPVTIAERIAWPGEAESPPPGGEDAPRGVRAPSGRR